MENHLIQLISFDEDFYNTLENKENILISKEGKYNTIQLNNIKVGIVGFIPSKKSKGEGFIQIVIKKEFRGQGILKDAEEMLVKKYNLSKLYATIDLENISSIKAHKKIGFEELSLESINELKQKKFLKKDQTRLFKNF